MSEAHETSTSHSRSWQRLALSAALFACEWAAGDEMSMRCEAALSEGYVLADRSGTISAMERMPENCLKSMLIQCSETADRQFMDLGSAAMCSMGYEALLRKSFGGSFHAFMEWWRRERAEALRH
jgi:hypothetical protein